MLASLIIAIKQEQQQKITRENYFGKNRTEKSSSRHSNQCLYESTENRIKLNKKKMYRKVTNKKNNTQHTNNSNKKNKSHKTHEFL